MFDIAGTVELGTICPGTGTWNRLQDGTTCAAQFGFIMLLLSWRIIVHTKVLCARMWKMLSQQVGLQRIWCMLCSKFYAFFYHQSGV